MELKNQLDDVTKEIEEVKAEVDKYQDSHERLELNDLSMRRCPSQTHASANHGVQRR